MLLFLFVLGGPLVLGIVALAPSSLGWVLRQIEHRFRERLLARRAEPLLAAT